MLTRSRFVHFKAHRQNRWSSFNVLIQSESSNKPRTFKRAEGKRVLTKVPEIPLINTNLNRSQWPHGLRRRSTAARLLGLCVRMAWMFVCCVCCVLSGRGLCDELITRPEESYRLWYVVVCDLENLMNEEPCPINVIELNIGDTSLDVFPTYH